MNVDPTFAKNASHLVHDKPLSRKISKTHDPNEAADRQNDPDKIYRRPHLKFFELLRSFEEINDHFWR